MDEPKCILNYFPCSFTEIVIIKLWLNNASGSLSFHLFFSIFLIKHREPISVVCEQFLVLQFWPIHEKLPQFNIMFTSTCNYIRIGTFSKRCKWPVDHSPSIKSYGYCRDVNTVETVQINKLNQDYFSEHCILSFVPKLLTGFNLFSESVYSEQYLI